MRWLLSTSQQLWQLGQLVSRSRGQRVPDLVSCTALISLALWIRLRRLHASAQYLFNAINSLSRSPHSTDVVNTHVPNLLSCPLQEVWRIFMLPINFLFLSVRPVVDMRVWVHDPAVDGLPPGSTATGGKARKMVCLEAVSAACSFSTPRKHCCQSW
jgi:hypothetical protein